MEQKHFIYQKHESSLSSLMFTLVSRTLAGSGMSKVANSIITTKNSIITTNRKENKVNRDSFTLSTCFLNHSNTREEAVEEAVRGPSSGEFLACEGLEED